MPVQIKMEKMKKSYISPKILIQEIEYGSLMGDPTSIPLSTDEVNASDAEARRNHGRTVVYEFDDIFAEDEFGDIHY